MTINRVWCCISDKSVEVVAADLLDWVLVEPALQARLVTPIKVVNESRQNVQFRAGKAVEVHFGQGTAGCEDIAEGIIEIAGGDLLVSIHKHRHIPIPISVEVDVVGCRGGVV